MVVKNGDEVMVSDRNKNHLGFGVTTYAGWYGKVTDLNENGSFVIDDGKRLLVITHTIKILVRDISGSWVLINHKIKK